MAEPNRPLHSIPPPDDDDDLDPISNRRGKAWHPKLTPYRLAVITTTLILGTAKAIATQRGSSLVSTTLEWIAGTLISIVFFVLGCYDSEDDVPSSLTWLFKPDCMDVVWRICGSLFSLKRPNYTSQERTYHYPVEGKKRPIITSYRIMVCTIVSSLGISKAVLGYYGESTSLTWVDWIVGSPVACIIYVMGLYENNPNEAWPTFFLVDQSSALVTVNVNLLGMVAASVWVTLSSRMLRAVSAWDWQSPSRPGGHTDTWRTFLDDCAQAGIKLFLQEILIASTGFGVFIAAYLIVNSIKLAIAAKPALGSFVIFRAFSHPLWRILWSEIKSVSRKSVHVITHLSGSAMMLLFFVMFLGTAIDTFREPLGFGVLLARTIFIFWTPFFLFLAGAFVYLMIEHFPK